jgi:DNA repair protein RadD
VRGHPHRRRQDAGDRHDLPGRGHGRWNGRVLVLAHVKELLEQTADKLRAVCPVVPFGVYSAGLKRRDTDRPVIIAGIQSVWKKACEFDPFDLVIVDETHLIPPEGDGMYRQFLDDARTVNPNLRVIGCTATPYRLKSGSICTPEGILNHVYYEVGVRELIVQGYLCPLVTKASKVKADTSRLHVRAGEFVPGEVEALMDDAELVRAACGEIVEQTAARNACLIFASGVKHGEHIVRVMREEHGLECGFITGDMASADRDETLSWFQSGRLKYLINVNVLTTGFDAPHIDCVVLLRPTMSPGLYYQMVGRGFRCTRPRPTAWCSIMAATCCGTARSTRSVLRSGLLVIGEAPAKECPECHALIAAGYAVCPECGHEFLPPEKQTHDAKASTAAVLSGQVTVETFSVRDVMFGVHTKRGAGEDAPKSLRVDYKVGWHRWKSEWVCLEHDGFARQKAVAWWKKRSKEPVPATAAEAVEIANAGGLASTKSITVRSVSGEEYDRITDHELGPIPELLDRGEARDAGDTEPLGDDALDFPFGYNVAANAERSCQATTKEEIPF